MIVTDLWWREPTRSIYVTIDGKQHNLKTDERVTAYIRLANLLREPEP